MRTLRNVAALVLALSWLATGHSAAQVPDTLDPAGYLPLEVGNIWEYERVAYRPASPLRDADSSFVNYERYAIIGTESIGDTLFHRLDLQVRNDDNRLLRRDTSLIRYDVGTGGMQARGEAGIFAHIECLDADVGEIPGNECPYSVTLHEGHFHPLFNDGRTSWIKQYFSFGFEYVLIHKFGPLMFGPVCEGCGVMSDDDRWDLVYARIGGIEYARAIVSNETLIPPSRGALQIYPNPASDYVHVVATGRRIEVFDILGRRVAQVDAGESGPVRLDVSDWPRGTYILFADGLGRVLTVR